MASRSVTYLAAAVAVCLLVSLAAAQDNAPATVQPARQFQGLTGDWTGLRTKLKSAGVTVTGDLTGYGNTLLVGESQNGLAPSGRFDLLVDFSTERLGLWKGGTVRTHTESRFGETQSNFGGALVPANTGALLPLPFGVNNRVAASSLYLAQSLGKRTTLLVGKINVLDLLAADPVLGGWAIKRFENVAFVAPPSGVLPPTVMGAFLIHQSRPITWTFMVADPLDRTNNYWVRGLFKEGVNGSVGATWNGVTFKRPSSVGLSAGFSTKRGTDLEDVFLPPDLRSGNKRGSYNISLSATHRLLESKQFKGKGLDLSIKAAIADGNPNPVQNSLIVGVAGHALIPDRPRDSFGIGAFRYDFSNALQSAAAPLVNFKDEAGLEAWYSFGLTPWFNLTADLQLVDPARGDRPRGFVAGLRGNLVF